MGEKFLTSSAKIGPLFAFVRFLRDAIERPVRKNQGLFKYPVCGFQGLFGAPSKYNEIQGLSRFFKDRGNPVEISCFLRFYLPYLHPN